MDSQENKMLQKCSKGYKKALLYFIISGSPITSMGHEVLKAEAIFQKSKK